MNCSLFLCLGVIVAFVAAAPVKGGDWELEQVIRAAAANPGVEDYDVEISHARKRLLEAMGRRHIELTPQLGLLTLTNPALLAANLGAGLLGRQNAVSPIAVLSSELDVIAAQIARQRWTFRREADVTDRFFELSRNQRVSRQACSGASGVEARRPEVARQLSLARLTRADVIQYEQELLDREVECRQARRRLDAAARNLSFVVGVAADTLRVSEEHDEEVNLEYPMQPVDYLVQVAMTHRSEPASLRDDLAALQRKVESAHRPKGFQFGLRYSYLGQQSSGVAGSGYLLGGNSLLPEISARITLKDSGEFDAEKQLLRLRISRVNREWQELEQEIRARISEIQAGFESWRDDMQSARRRLALSREYRGITAARQRAGLETLASLHSVEDNERRAGMDVARLEYEGGSKLAAILSLCGLKNMPVARQELLLTRQLPVSTEPVP
ncbi:MAG: hypothetical protein ABJF23_13480 [Bryobacteraceae bacterium]